MNRLATETSPYLRQHRDNPVDWYPWGEEAFAAARERDVPILLSVGYSACHWCHVMAHECFEDDEVAAAMNAAFVNVKLDREERPDVDGLYMEALTALTGRGGWPMTMALHHDGRPFFGGTYFPKDAFLKVIEGLTEVWTTRRDELDKQATQLTEKLTKVAETVAAKDVPGVELVNE
ncbi:MAG: thioredoxin domain-containing protein, partial [Ilumatobacter fluminis]